MIAVFNRKELLVTMNYDQQINTQETLKITILGMCPVQ